MRVRWLSGAAQARAGQIGHIARRDPKAALLRRHPALGRAGRVPGMPDPVVSRTPFILVYRIESDGIVILRLLHGAQDCPGPP